MPAPKIDDNKLDNLFTYYHQRFTVAPLPPVEQLIYDLIVDLQNERDTTEALKLSLADARMPRTITDISKSIE